jgi:hypothetical protein
VCDGTRPHCVHVERRIDALRGRSIYSSL